MGGLSLVVRPVAIRFGRRFGLLGSVTIGLRRPYSSQVDHEAQRWKRLKFDRGALSSPVSLRAMWH